MALPPQQFCVRWNSYHTNLQSWFPRLLLSEQFADVTLACESRQLRCHKVVLSACSAYLERLLAQNPCKHPIVLMRDMRFSEMQALVDFMYKGEVNVTQEELPSLLKSAEALQIRGLCSSESGVCESENKDFSVASDALLAHAHTQNGSSTKPQSPAAAPVNNSHGNKSDERGDVKEETVEEDGLYYGELDNDHMEYNEDEEPGKPSSSIAQTSGQFIRVKPESELFFQNKLQNLAKSNDYLTNLSKMTPSENQTYDKTENDYYKTWLEQNGQLEVSLLRASQAKKQKIEKNQKSEVELIPKPNRKENFPKIGETYPKIGEIFPKIGENFPKIGEKIKRRGRPPIFKDKNLDIGESVLKSDLEQFLEGKEVSSSGLSRRELERVMMGKYNPNRRYSNEAMWAALMDVKKGGSIYRAAQTHKVPRKSLRNWMKRCHIKSSFPMPQQLKQFVENSKKQKEYKNYEFSAEKPETNYEAEMEFGKHFLFNQLSSDESAKLEGGENLSDGNTALNMSIHE